MGATHRSRPIKRIFLIHCRWRCYDISSVGVASCVENRAFLSESASLVPDAASDISHAPLHSQFLTDKRKHLLDILGKHSNRLQLRHSSSRAAGGNVFMPVSKSTANTDGRGARGFRRNSWARHKKPAVCGSTADGGLFAKRRGFCTAP